MAAPITLQYLARHRPRRMAANNPPADPFAPRTDQQIRAGALADASAVVNPIVAEIARTIGARTKAGMGAITGYTNEAATKLGGYGQQADRNYAEAGGRQAGIENALVQRLTGQGTDLSESLGKTLAATGTSDPALLARVAQTGRDAGNAGYAIGSASMSRLNADRANERAYAEKLPGLARLAGVQSARELQLSSQRDLADQTGEERAKLPGIVAELIRTARGNELDKSLARAARETKSKEIEAHAAADVADRQAETQKALADRQFEMDKLERQHELEMEKARAAFERSQRTAADRRAFEARQKQLQRAHDAKQREIDRKARAALSKKTGSGSLPEQIAEALNK